ncbi:hypothetical protein WISP_19612 [Willisornis vidua]|uniref:Uncharacterized protein n=1 Tax=Willisornis vidua TaxID=1566151 RepID=A0ABQ9DNT1_9PASS|nr:hypothetical protein WISP_19612 [Willisornis vidua]
MIVLPTRGTLTDRRTGEELMKIKTKKSKIVHLGMIKPRHQYWSGFGGLERSLVEKDLSVSVDNKLITNLQWALVTKKVNPGLYDTPADDSFPLFSIGEATSGVTCPVQSYPVQDTVE